ncbi:MAG: DNA-binding protein [Thiobacillus sp.]|nr:DNA-binding protein [Thiobacillus sp.]
MKTVLFEVASLEKVMERTKAALRAGKPDKYAHVSFDSAAHMARIMTPLRWGIVEAMTGAGPLGVRELARRLGRDVSAVHADCAALVTSGVIDRTPEGKYLFPFDHVKVQFDLHARAA